MNTKTTGIILATMIMSELETYGGERWRGGQSHAWKLLQWVVRRYGIREFEQDILHGFLRADVLHYRNRMRSR